MYTITECTAVESKPFICMASKPLYFNISSSSTVQRCFTLAVNYHIWIFSQPPLVNLLFVFDPVMFSSVSVTFPVVWKKWSINLPKSEALLDNTFSRQKINTSMLTLPFSKSESPDKISKHPQH